MHLNKANLYLKLLKSSRIRLFDTEICKGINLHGNFVNDKRELLHFGLEVKESSCNVHLTLHGGAFTTLIDCLTTIHSWALDPEGRICISTELSVSFYSTAPVNSYIDIYTDVVSIQKEFAKADAIVYLNKIPIAKGTHTLFFLNKSVDSLIHSHNQ